MTCIVISLCWQLIFVLASGETQEEHQELAQFCQEFPFQRMGAFTYSEEDGTPAAAYQNQVKLQLILILSVSQSCLSSCRLTRDESSQQPPMYVLSMTAIYLYAPGQ